MCAGNLWPLQRCLTLVERSASNVSSFAFLPVFPLKNGFNIRIFYLKPSESARHNRIFPERRAIYRHLHDTCHREVSACGHTQKRQVIHDETLIESTMSTLINGSMAQRFQPYNTPTQGAADTCPSASAQNDHGRPSRQQPYNANHGWNRPQPSRPGNHWQRPQPTRPENAWNRPQPARPGNDWQRPPHNGGYRPQPTRPENSWQPPQNQWERPHNGGGYRPQVTDRPPIHDGARPNQASYATTRYEAAYSERADDASYV